MNWQRTATLGVFGGALAAWLAGAATSTGRRVVDTAIAKPSPVELRGAELAAEIARLRERLHPTIEPQQPTRNLFQFSMAANPPRDRAATPISPPALVPSEAPAQPQAAPPALKLIGIAEDPGSDGPVRTAIISGFSQLFFAREGESVAGRYRVRSLSGEGAELTDLVDATTLRLALK